MSLYTEYLKNNKNREADGLSPKPIEDASLLAEIIYKILNEADDNREAALNFLIFNTMPGTTGAAGVKAKFLRDIITGEEAIEEISPSYAFELLSHMRGGPSIEVLLDLALGNNETIARQAADVVKTQVFLYDADTARLESAYRAGNKLAHEILISYSRAEFFTSLPKVDNEIKITTLR